MVPVSEWEEFRESVFSPGDMAVAFSDERAPLPTGVAKWDAELGGGLRPGLNVLIGQPGTGKSALALQASYNLARRGFRVLYESIEMDCWSCWKRLCSLSSVYEDESLQFCWSSVFDMKGQPGGIEKFFRQHAKLSSMKELAIWHGQPTLTDVLEVTADAIRSGADCIAIDYAQYIEAPGDTDSDRVGAVANALNAMATNARIPMLLLSSMNRDGMKQSEPTMFSAAGSSKLEFNAESFTALYRERDEEARPSAGSRGVSLKVLKNRNGGSVSKEPATLEFFGCYNYFR